MTLPRLESLIRMFKAASGKDRFKSSMDYWITRYAHGGNSGAGSYNHLAAFKAEVINRLVSQRHVNSVIEFGCGDGNQLTYAEYPAYLGVDISPNAIQLCRSKFANDHTKSFLLLSEYQSEQAELALSLDVIYHLVEDDVFDNYMNVLFCGATRFIAIYSSNVDAKEDKRTPHIRHRKFSRWITANAPEWNLIDTVRNRYPYNGDHITTTFSDFFIYENRAS